MGNSQPEYYYDEQPYFDYDSFSQFELCTISIPYDLVPMYVDWYEERLQRNTPFVRIVDYKEDPKCCTCSTTDDFKVYTERLFFLDQLTLSYPEAIFFLKQCITTLDRLYDQFGIFKVTPRMVGANHKGRVKVWVNENFAENLPEEQNEYLDQQDVVCDLVDMIQEATQDYRLTRVMQAYIGSLTFSNTIKVLNMMQAQQGLAVNKIFLDLKEYEAEMTKVILAKNQPQESVLQTTYQYAPQANPTYYSYDIPQHQYIQSPQISIPSLPVQQKHHYQSSIPQQVNLAPTTTLSYTDPYAHNPLSVLKLYQPPPVHQHQVHRYSQAQGIQRINKHQRVMVPQKQRKPQINIGNRPVIHRQPVTEVDMIKLQADIRKKQHQEKLKKKLQENYNQIPQVQSVIVVVQQEDRTRRNLDKISVPRGPANQHQRQAPTLKNQPKPQMHPQQPIPGRPTTNINQPMNIKQMNLQSEIFNLF